MAENTVHTWTLDSEAIASAFTQADPCQLSQQQQQQQQQETWFENISINGDREDAEGME
jgi:invasion protein IalB